MYGSSLESGLVVQCGCVNVLVCFPLCVQQKSLLSQPQVPIRGGVSGDGNRQSQSGKKAAAAAAADTTSEVTGQLRIMV